MKEHLAGACCGLNKRWASTGWYAMKVTPNCCEEEDIRSRKQDTLISEAEHEETMLT